MRASLWLTGPVFHDPFERAASAFVEVEPARQRFDAHLQVVYFDAGARDLEHQVVQHFVVQRIESDVGLLALAHPVLDLIVDLRLGLRLRLDEMHQRVRIDEELQNGVEQLSNPEEQPAMRAVDRDVLQLEFWQRRCRRVLAPMKVDQIRADAARIQKFLQLDLRKLLDLRFRVIDAALLANARADLPHDLLDVDRIGSDVEVGHGGIRTSVIQNSKFKNSQSKFNVDTAPTT